VIKASYPYGGVALVPARFHRGPHKFLLSSHIISAARELILCGIEAGHFARLRKRRNPMKTLILAAFAALSLTTAIAPAANAFVRGVPHTAYHSGPYDNTGRGPGETGMEGGGG
jgi:hypothetical protein